MRSNEVCYEVEAKTPPYGAENVTSDFLHSSHQAYAVIDLRKELEHEHQE